MLGSRSRPGDRFSTVEHRRDTCESPVVESLGPRAASAAAFATTEHFNLQTARAQTVSEANGRAALYLAALSSSLLALAFIGQKSQVGVAFTTSALILLPVLTFVGVVTFLRLVQLSVEDLAFAQRIARVRRFYLQVAPELEAFFVVAHSTGSNASPVDRHVTPRRGQLVLTVAGMVACVNSVIVAVCVGSVLAAAGIESLVAAVAAGSITALAALWTQERHHRSRLAACSLVAVDRAAILAPDDS